MVMKCAAVCLVALSLLSHLCDAQWGHFVSEPSKPKYEQTQVPVGQKPSKGRDPVQTKQVFEKPIDWGYPILPKEDPKPEVAFELRQPVSAATVAVECRERIARVEVMKDFFGIGQLINAKDMELGNCPAVAEDSAAQVLIFEAQLHECGSSLTMTDDSLIYTFTLNYVPQSLGPSPVVRTTTAAVIVQCHYPRNHNVSSLPLVPLWIPFSAAKVAEEFLYFTLKLMTEDWQHERPVYKYYLGDIIHIEATVKQYFHVPLRVFVDNCVAAPTPDTSLTPRYAFIENHGCYVDARLTGSNSRFLARTAENKLRFSLEAFRFQNADSGVATKTAAADLIYIVCHLKATSTMYPLDGYHRACSYINGWKEASGADAVCDSCESGLPATNPGTSPGRKMRDVSTQTFEWEGDVTIGPIGIEEREIA